MPSLPDDTTNGPIGSAPSLEAALRHRTWVRALAASLVGESSLADDVAQEAWIRVMASPPPGNATWRNWLAGVVRNVVRDTRRSNARRARREAEAARSEADESSSELLERVEEEGVLVQLVLDLDEPYRSAILRRYFDGWSVARIAHECEAPEPTVRTRLRRALARLREALDKRYGGDRKAWMSAVTALAAPVGNGVGTGTLVIGGMAMGTMMKVSAGVVVAAACVYFVARTPRDESPQMASVEPRATDVDVVGVAVASAAEDPATEAGRRTPVTEEPPARVSAARGTNVLRVVLEGITEDDARMTRVTLTAVDEREERIAEIRDSWPCQGLTSEFDLDPFFAVVAERDGNLRIDELEVHVDHPLHLIETTRIPMSRDVELSDGRTVHEVRVRLISAAVIHGRLARADGAPAADGLVGALLLEGDFPIEDEGRAVECAADGAFELRVPASDLYALASFEEGRRPTTTRVEALVGTRVDVGVIVLESGHSITGDARRQGKPLAGVTISATPPTWRTASAPDAVNNGMHASVYEGRNFATPDRSVHFLWLPPNFSTYETEQKPGSRKNGRFELAGQRVSSDENGAFAFVGLGSGDYLLRMRQLAEAPDSVPGYWGDSEREEMYEIHGDRPALVVRAPGHGVVFRFHWTAIRFELAGDLESGDEGRLVLRTRSAGGGTPVDENGIDLRLVADPGARNLNFTPEYLTTEFPLSGDKPTYVLQAPPNIQITGEVAFPGRQPVPLEFWTPEPGGELVIPIQLVRAEELATLVIELENPLTEIPETFSVMLWRAELDDAPPDTHLVEVAEGQLRVEGIFPGKYRVRVRAGGDRNYSAGLFHENEFDLELHPGLVVTRSIMMWQGAGLRVTLRDEDGALLTGEYEFYDHLGASRDLNLYVFEDNRRWGSSWKIYPHGTHESSNELHPGRYRLVLLSPGYAKRSVMLELRAGEYEDVDVTLSH